MKKIDRDGSILCDLQARTFELSLTEQNTSSPIFIRRFMHSRIAKDLDSGAILQTNIQPKDILDMIDEEYGRSSYGSEKYSPAELHWIGYMYRYYAYTFERSSNQVYKTIKPRELRGLFLPYHTMDPAQALDRILEAGGITTDNAAEEIRQYEILKRVRMSRGGIL